MKCYKCGGEIAVFKLKLGVNDYICAPCTYDITKLGGKLIMPFTKSELEKIRNGKKWTSLRSLKYDKYPFEKIRVLIWHLPKHDWGGKQFRKPSNFISIRNLETESNEAITIDAYTSEGFNSREELCIALKKMRYKLPKEMLLYDLRKPL